MGVVGRIDAARHPQALQYIAAGHRNQPRMLIVVVQSVALSNAFDGDAGKRTQALCLFIMPGRNLTSLRAADDVMVFIDTLPMNRSRSTGRLSQVSAA